VITGIQRSDHVLAVDTSGVGRRAARPDRRTTVIQHCKMAFVVLWLAGGALLVAAL
jgi:hypothetical protein